VSRRAKKAAPIDIEARHRGSCLHSLRMAWLDRNAHDPLRRLFARSRIRSQIEQLRRLGPGPVEQVQVAGGFWTVPETYWPAVHSVPRIAALLTRAGRIALEMRRTA
jgi:hypothetical protein